MSAMLEKIKKIVAAILSLFAMMLPLAEPGIAMDIEIRNEPTQTVYVKWQNNTFSTISMPRFFVEQNVNGQWETVEFDEYFGFPEIYDRYFPLQGNAFTVRCKEVFGKDLEPGMYRFNIQYHVQSAGGIQDRIASQEFEIFQSPGV
ncbi:MAG: hypothetical protein IKM24_00150 [Clostridia bacterium]|nr:hypothetical protein [Clostridia bacterium]MBR6779415.1 hypothetical protein [Clostridia bacterium]